MPSTLAEAYAVLQARESWTPPADYDTVEKFLTYCLQSLATETVTSSMDHLMVHLGRILNEMSCPALVR